MEVDNLEKNPNDFLISDINGVKMEKEDSKMQQDGD